jgi:uronate dehydrogenase
MPRYQRILITGAAGGIGRVLREKLRGRYPAIRLSDVKPLGSAAPGEELVVADMQDIEAMERLMAGVGAVVHLGGTSVEAPWEPVLRNNIIGLYNVYEAARRQGVKRIVFASSNHVIGFYRREATVTAESPPRPDSRYGVSKMFAEGLGRLYADKHDMEIVNIRIGSFQEKPLNPRMLGTFISHRDMVQLVERCLEAKDVHFEIVYGVSRNTRNRWRDDFAARIGYNPEDDAEAHAVETLARMAPEDEPPNERAFHGGPYCGMEFTGSLEKIK